MAALTYSKVLKDYILILNENVTMGKIFIKAKGHHC